MCVQLLGCTMTEQEINEYEKLVEDEIRKDIEYGEEMIKAYKEI